MKKIIFISFILISFIGKSQSNSMFSKKYLSYGGGINYSNNIGFELGLSFRFENEIQNSEHKKFKQIGFPIGVEYFLGNEHKYVLPKVGIEFTSWKFASRLTLMNFTDFNYNEIKVLPELGMSLVAGTIRVMYGYYIPLNSNSLGKKHSLSILFYFPKKNE